jgi:hypothetical protein
MVRLMSSLDQPAIEDVERRVSATLSAGIGPVLIPFPVFDATGADLRVTVNGIVKALSTDWTFSASLVVGTFGQPNCWVDGEVTFLSAQTGTVVVSGRRRPRRSDQFTEGAGVPARELNAAFNVVAATQRELYDRFDNDLGDLEATRESLDQAVADAEAARDAASASASAADASADSSAASAAAAAVTKSQVETMASLLGSPDLGAFPDAFSDSFDLGAFP